VGGKIEEEERERENGVREKKNRRGGRRQPEREDCVNQGYVSGDVFPITQKMDRFTMKATRPDPRINSCIKTNRSTS
jgi:hypothetical protein